MKTYQQSPHAQASLQFTVLFLKYSIIRLFCVLFSDIPVKQIQGKAMKPNIISEFRKKCCKIVKYS